MAEYRINPLPIYWISCGMSPKGNRSGRIVERTEFTLILTTDPKGNAMDMLGSARQLHARLRKHQYLEARINDVEQLKVLHSMIGGVLEILEKESVDAS